MAGLASPLYAQTPVPKVSLTLRPDLFTNVWPADFNRDGRTDLVAGSGPFHPTTHLTIAFGRGDGTFTPSRTLGIGGIPLDVGDMNGDGFVDVLFRRGDSLELLPGRGDGTFAAPRVIAATNAFTDEVRVWAYITDLDGDGRRDVIVPEPMDTLKFYRGNGDLTFKPAVDLFTRGGGYQPAGATSGDFNGDGRRDLAVVSPGEIDIFLNRGGTTFDRSTLDGWPFTDMTARDLNNDGRLDLIVSSGRWDMFESWVDPGMVYVLLGNGNGTFQNRIGYETGVFGAMTVVAGDFNGDGRQDVATANRSIVIEDNELGMVFADSVTVLPGDGTGRLLEPTTFTLKAVEPEFGWWNHDDPYRAKQHQLNTSDLNGDGRTDLIASPGAILLNRPAAANRAPVAFAGADRTEFYYDMHLVLRGQGIDPDHHWVNYTWRDDTGAVISRLSGALATQDPGTSRTYTLTVDDGHGGVSTDSITVYVRADGDPFIGLERPLFPESVVRGVDYTVAWNIHDPSGILTALTLTYSVDDGRTFQAVPGCTGLAPRTGQCVWQNPGPLSDMVRLRLVATGDGRDWIALSTRTSITDMPAGWSSSDIGSVAAAGTTAFAGGTWTIEGSGADIWGTADEFRFVSRLVYGDFSAVVRVASIENLDRWVKAGLMVREDLSAGARHVSILATPRTDRGIAFQRRRQANGISVHSAGPAVAPPGWLAIGRIGDTISAYYRPSANAPWTLVGRDVLSGLSIGVQVGLAVSSHVDGTLATAVFDNLEVDQALLTSSFDVGSVRIAGSTTYDGIVHEVRASGADIWGTSDAFRIVRGSRWARELTAKVRSVSNTHVWAKAGVMFRQSPESAQSPHVTVVVTPGKGVAMQYRPSFNAQSVQVAVRAGTAPEWVRLTQVEGTFKGYASEDGVTWHLIGTITLDWSGEPALAVTSHNNGALTTAIFENVRLQGFLSR